MRDIWQDYEQLKTARRMAYHCEGYCDQQVALAKASGDTELMHYYLETADQYYNDWLRIVEDMR